MATPHGDFVWYELMTTDLQAAERFYGAVLGWQARDSGMPGVAYSLMSADGADVGGAMVLPESAREAGGEPSWLGYVAVDDVDTSARRAAELGGRVLREPGDIPGVGRWALIVDPSGAPLAIFKAAGGASFEPSAPGTAGHVGWRELMAGDLERSFAFHADLFGWSRVEAHDMGPMGIYQTFKGSSGEIGGMMTKPAEMPAPLWTYYFNVGNIDDAAGRVTAAGGEITFGPIEVPGGMWVVNCRDPQGVNFALLGSRG